MKRMNEILVAVVMTTASGCGDDGSPGVSRRAFFVSRFARATCA